MRFPFEPPCTAHFGSSISRSSSSRKNAANAPVLAGAEVAAVEDTGVSMDAAAEVAFEAGRAPQRTRVTRRIVPEPLRLRELTRGLVRRSVVHFTLISAVSPK